MRAHQAGLALFSALARVPSGAGACENLGLTNQTRPFRPIHAHSRPFTPIHALTHALTHAPDTHPHHTHNLSSNIALHMEGNMWTVRAVAPSWDKPQAQAQTQTAPPLARAVPKE
ncbi:hypothetical protein E4U54_004743 [Claviceps lovelessii]|nr:hypothetical protein E4U54_004743 [Claviceps lovelessii]